MLYDRLALVALTLSEICGLAVAAERPSAPRFQEASTPAVVTIPAGEFEMGDHFGFVDPKHPSDETPIHKVRVDSFYMGVNDVTTLQYCQFLNTAFLQGTIEVKKTGVYLFGGGEMLCDTRESSPSAEISWDGRKFHVLDHKEDHPMVCVRWAGAAAYCNWLSAQNKLPPCYDMSTWTCDFTKSGFRLPTEAEWEWAARGGQTDPYFNYPWGNDTDPLKANVPESKNPFRAVNGPTAPPAGYKSDRGPAGQAWRMGTLPQTTPVGFFNGELRQKADFGWPGEQEEFQTHNGANGYGLYDMAGNVWQWCTEWYDRGYYEYSPSVNPPGPAKGSPMPDGKPYRCMRGGSWFNGPFGHSRVSNRDPSYFRGPDPVTGLSDADGPWFHIGFRVMLPITNESRPAAKATPKQSGFVLTSAVMTDGGTMPKEFTGDGAGVSPPLEWSGAPAGTKSYALIMHHTDAKGVYVSYWLLHNIPANVQSLARGATGVGVLGVGSRGHEKGYIPPHSAGPGTRTYVFTVYALSGQPFGTAPGEVGHETLLAAMKDKILASADLSVSYTRYTVADGQAQAPQPPPQREEQGRDSGNGRPPRPAEQRAGGGGGGRVAESNKTPTSPNAGQTVGVFVNTPKACPGYTLLAPKHNTTTYLINNDGQVVNQWKSEYFPGQSVYLKPNGNMVHTCMLHNRSFTGGGEGGRIEEYDWSGKLIWQFTYSDNQRQQHHDVAVLPNGNILMLVVEKKSRADCLAAGFPAEMLRDAELYPDSIVEVQPVYPNGGKVVWEWHVWDHMIQDFDKSKANYGDVMAHPELIYLRGGRGAPAFWNHVNSIAYSARLDQITISARGNDEIWFIDHSTTTKESAGHTGGKHGKGGDLIYRWGNPAAYLRGKTAWLNQQHDSEWVPDGYPGAGNVTIFNNGYNRGYTSIEEITPPLDASGHYILAPDKAYGPDTTAWHYEAKNRTDFFSSEISGAHRLPNGNTMICSGVVGNLFEVTPAGEMVWQYVNPVVRGGVLAQGELPGTDVRGHLFNAVFKAHRYALDFPGFAGRDLTPKGVIELPVSQKGKTGLDKADASPNERPGGKGEPGGSGSGGGRPPRGDRPGARQ